ncbi:MAG: efflux RND transporter periplasmic adaptor subunit [Bacteroidia bacterium]
MNKLKIAFLFITGIFIGCSDLKNKQEESKLEPLAYTLYTDKSEIFVEFKPLIVGQKIKFAAHFTILGEKFLPLEKAKVTVSLIVDDKGISNTTPEPSVPGIFRLALEPTVHGTGKLIFDIETPDYTDQIIIENVQVYADEKSAIADQLTDEGGGGEITYLKEQAWKVEFSNAPVKKQTFYEVIKTSGQIMAAPGDEIVITAKSSGIVFFSGNNSIVGSSISKGESIFTISGAGLTEENIDTKFKEAKSNYEKAKADYERAQELIKDKIISQKEFLEKQNKYETTQTIFNSLAQNYTGNGTKITSPISGYLKNIYVTEGEFVQVGDPIASVSQNKQIVLKADVSQKYFSKLASIQSANFITVDGKIYNTSDLNGKVIAYGKSANEHSAFIPATFEIDNRGEILSGSYVDVYLRSNPIENAMVIPITALIEEQGLYYVYVQLKGESFTKREVKLGGNDGVNVHVLSGLSEHERVVTKGAYNIKLSVASGALPAHGHEH